MGETAKRIFSGAVLLGIVTMAIRYSEPLFWLPVVLVVLAVVLLGLYEFYTLADRGIDGRPLRKTGLLFAVLFAVSFYGMLLDAQRIYSIEELPSVLESIARIGSFSLFALLFFLVFFVMMFQLFFRPIDGAIYSISATLAGLLYAGFPVLHAILYFSFTNAAAYLVFAILITAMTDAGAYFAGRWFGRHNAGLKVSPRKTYEGYLGGFVSAILGAAVFVSFAGAWMGDASFTYPEATVLAMCLSAVSVVGDLTESVLKRDAKMKDSASLIPGHGGVLDLADALFFTIPVLYYYLHYKQFFGYPV